MLIVLTQPMKDSLRQRGIECFLAPGYVNISTDAVFEPPCSIKWMAIENNVSLGAFSYAVSGYFSNVTIGRYTSIGEAVQSAPLIAAFLELRWWRYAPWQLQGIDFSQPSLAVEALRHRLADLLPYQSDTVSVRELAEG